MALDHDEKERAQARQERILDAKPKEIGGDAYWALRSGDVSMFHTKMESLDELDLSDADLRGVDFRGVNLEKVTLRGAYLRDTDLRGVDLRGLDLDGCSIYHAKIRGTFFPDSLDAAEIRFGLECGARLRTKK